MVSDPARRTPGLFAWLLEQLGFSVRRVSASYYMEDKQEFKGEFDHLALVVELADREYLVDAGWGQPNQPLAPVRVEPAGAEHRQAGGGYRLVPGLGEGGGRVLEHRRRAVFGHHNPLLNREEAGDWYPVFRSVGRWLVNWNRASRNCLSSFGWRHLSPEVATEALEK
jgi:arylamine N-acetyltransferase